jgi:hypothetical protein
MVSKKENNKKKINENKTSKSDVTIKIPRELYKNLQRVIKGTGFSCVTDFIVFAMRDIASMGNVGAKNISMEQAEIVKEKLKSLGYIK